VLSAGLLDRSGEQGTTSVSGSGPTVCKPANHSVKMDFTAWKNYNDIAGVILRIVELKANDSGLAILLFDRFISELVSVNAVGLGIICCSLLVWHVVSFDCFFGSKLALLSSLPDWFLQSLFLKVLHSANGVIRR